MPTIVAKDLTIGVCHSAYQIEPVIRERLPAVRVFQEFSTQAMLPRMPAGEIAGAALDVIVAEPLQPTSPLWEMPNVLITPHTGGETSLYEKRLVDIMVDNIRRWEQGEPFIHQIV